MDFTTNKLTQLLNKLKDSNYQFATLAEHLKHGGEKVAILRHDIDNLPHNALKIAQLEASLNIRGSFYFRIVKKSFNLKIMKMIKEMNHEIGYHYEDVDLVNRASKRNSKKQIKKGELIDLAYESFVKNYTIMNNLFDVKTICMHGSPLAKFDNKIIWEKYDYKALNILGEPYFDIDYSEFVYLTDTGRRWNGEKYNVRDKVNSKFDFNFKKTDDIISNIDKLPNKILITLHPQRWNKFGSYWIIQSIAQNIKNIIKFLIVKLR